MLKSLIIYSQHYKFIATNYLRVYYNILILLFLICYVFLCFIFIILPIVLIFLNPLQIWPASPQLYDLFTYLKKINLNPTPLLTLPKLLRRCYFHQKTPFYYERRYCSQINCCHIYINCLQKNNFHHTSHSFALLKKHHIFRWRSFCADKHAAGHI